MPMPSTRLRKVSPWTASRSRRRYLGAESSGNASRICCAVQAEVGALVTPKWTTWDNRRASWPSMPRLPSPPGAKALAMPADDGRGLYQGAEPRASATSGGKAEPRRLARAVRTAAASSGGAGEQVVAEGQGSRATDPRALGAPSESSPAGRQRRTTVGGQPGPSRKSPSSRAIRFWPRTGAQLRAASPATPTGPRASRISTTGGWSPAAALA